MSHPPVPHAKYNTLPRPHASPTPMVTPMEDDDDDRCPAPAPSASSAMGSSSSSSSSRSSTTSRALAPIGPRSPQGLGTPVQPMTGRLSSTVAQFAPPQLPSASAQSIQRVSHTPLNEPGPHLAPRFSPMLVPPPILPPVPSPPCSTPMWTSPTSVITKTGEVLPWPPSGSSPRTAVAVAGSSAVSSPPRLLSGSRSLALSPCTAPPAHSAVSAACASLAQRALLPPPALPSRSRPANASSLSQAHFPPLPAIGADTSRAGLSGGLPSLLPGIPPSACVLPRSNHFSLPSLSSMVSSSSLSDTGRLPIASKSTSSSHALPSSTVTFHPPSITQACHSSPHLSHSSSRSSTSGSMPRSSAPFVSSNFSSTSSTDPQTNCLVCPKALLPSNQQRGGQSPLLNAVHSHRTPVPPAMTATTPLPLPHGPTPTPIPAASASSRSRKRPREPPVARRRRRPPSSSSRSPSPRSPAPRRSRRSGGTARRTSSPSSGDTSAGDSSSTSSSRSPPPPAPVPPPASASTATARRTVSCKCVHTVGTDSNFRVHIPQHDVVPLTRSDDFTSLWLNGPTINAIIMSSCGELRDPSASYLGSCYFPENLRKAEHKFVAKCQRSIQAKRDLIMVINVGSAHWVLLAVDATRQVACLFDPMSSSHVDFSIILFAARIFYKVDELRAAYGSHAEGKSIDTIRRVSVRSQLKGLNLPFFKLVNVGVQLDNEDGESCGLLCALWARNLIFERSEKLLQSKRDDRMTPQSLWLSPGALEDQRSYWTYALLEHAYPASASCVYKLNGPAIRTRNRVKAGVSNTEYDVLECINSCRFCCVHRYYDSLREDPRAFSACTTMRSLREGLALWHEEHGDTEIEIVD